MVILILATILAVALVIGISLFWTWGAIRWRRGARSDSTALPTVSVIIAGRNEERYIRNTLDSVLRCDYPTPLLEVVFVDDHSDDRTVRLAQAIAEESGGRMRALNAPPTPTGHSPKKSALAFGIRQSHGEILLFTDADSEVQLGWIRSMAGSYDEDTGAVAGATLPAASGGLHHRLYRLERFMAALSSASAIGYGSPASVTGQNFSFRRRAFESVGGYAQPRATSGDDDLMAQAIARQGWTMKFCADPESVVTDLRPPDVRSHLAAASRHQSTIRYYPWRWRAAYLLTILAGWILLAGVVYSLFHRQYLGIAAPVIAVKMLADSVSVRVLTRQLKIRLTFLEFMCSETVIPFYLIARPLLAFRSSFDWRGRTHQAITPPSADILA